MSVGRDFGHNKLWSIGITGMLWTSINFDQRVAVSYSDLLLVVSGVPQDSILGPLLCIFSLH